jgi:NAD(P)-dependent dehydrogenase (short-subunit alcohol dehydrogenase family)
MLKGKRILVTGATSGIGNEIARQCVANGASVIFCGRSVEKLSSLEAEFGTEHLYVQADLSNDEGIQSILNASEQLHGVVHAAGVLKTLPARFINREALNEIMNTNFYAAVLLNSGLLKKKVIQKGGSIVFISSIAGNVIAFKGNGLYSATKGALNAYAKVLALELANQHIIVNTINPGMVKTNMWEGGHSLISADQLEEDQKKYPLGYGEPKDVSEMCVFLLSAKAKWITGSNVVLDGGFTIQ